MIKARKNIPFNSALQKAMYYCSYQERCKQDLENRFIAWGVKKSDYNRLFKQLIEGNFLNEQRYITAFIRDKFFIRKWGINKIVMALAQKRIFDKKLITATFNSEIDENDYEKTMIDLLTKKSALINTTDPQEKKAKLYRYMINKGFEPDLVMKKLSDLC